MHIVPKKAEVTVTMNDKGKEIENTTSDKMASLHRLLEAQFCDKEGSLLLTIHRLDPGLFGKTELLLLPGWILELQSDRNSSG